MKDGVDVTNGGMELNKTPYLKKNGSYKEARNITLMSIDLFTNESAKVVEGVNLWEVMVRDGE